MSAVFHSPMDTSPLYMRFEVLPRLTPGQTSHPFILFAHLSADMSQLRVP